MRIDLEDLLFAGRGSSALWAILKSITVSKPNVLLPVNICEIVYPVIKKAGYTPVFYDVDSISGNAQLDDIRDVFTGNESVLIVVHNFGAPVKIDQIARWAKENNVFLIEDVCNAIGATYNEKPLGLFGDAAFFSFGYAKIVEYGIGGALLIKDADLMSVVRGLICSLDEYTEYHKNKDMDFQRRLREMRQAGVTKTPSVYWPFYKEYLDYLLYKISAKAEVEIKILLKNLDRNLQERAQKALRYRTEIKSLKMKHIDEVPGQVYWRYNLLVDPDCRDDLLAKLRRNNIFASAWYPPIIELFEQDSHASTYPGSRAFSQSIINLFVDYRVSQDDVSETISIINNF